MGVPVATVLGRAPEAGRVKTRLAAAIGAAAAAEVHEALALDTLRRLAEWRASRGGRPEGLVLALDGSDPACERFGSMAAERFGLRTERQGGGDLGRRMEEALARRSAEGEGCSLVLGTDAPLLSDGLLEAAAGALRDGGPGTAAVLVPARDGGFVLLGLRGSLPGRPLAGLPWGGPAALASTRRALEGAGVGVHLVGSGEDVDRLEDLLRLSAVLRSEPERAPSTALWLEGHLSAWAEPR